jgi:hypothetical protein
MNLKTKPTHAEKIGQLEAGLDFQNRESTYILEMVRKHHVELQEQTETVSELSEIMKIYSILLLVCIGLTLYFVVR